MGPSGFLGPVLSRPVPGPSRDFPGRDSPAGKPSSDGDFKNVPECTVVVNVALGPYPNGTSEIKITTKSKFYSHFVI